MALTFVCQRVKRIIMKCFTPALLFSLASLALGVVAQAAPSEFIQLQIKEREARLDELAVDIKRLDAKIEKKIDRLEQRFLNVKDSRESQITVQQTKEKLIQGLGDLAKYYAGQRDLFLKESQSSNPRADEETLKKAVEAYDQHIDKRIEQITRLNQSLASPHPDSKQGNDKQLARRTREQREEAQQALTKIIDRLEKENKELALRIKSMSAQEAESVTEQIEHNQELIDRRTRQLEQMADAPQTAAKPVSKSEALQLRKLLEAEAQDIKEDSYRLANLAIEYAKEVEAIRQLKHELAAQPEDGHSH